jgi:ankyrin repeat protein
VVTGRAAYPHRAVGPRQPAYLHRAAALVPSVRRSHPAQANRRSTNSATDQTVDGNFAGVRRAGRTHRSGTELLTRLQRQKGQIYSSRSISPLISSERAQAATVARLIAAGADPNATDKSGVTPLHRAVRTRCAAAVKALLEVGADPRRKNNSGSTPMLLAAQNTGRGGSGSSEAKAQQELIVQLLRERLNRQI